MMWEHGAGIDDIAWSPVNGLYEGDSLPAHVCCVRSGVSPMSVKFIRNGVDMGVDVGSLTPPDGGGSSLVEAFREPTYNNQLYNGYAWNIRVYDHALSVSDVLAIYNSELPESERVMKLNGSGLDPVNYPLAGWVGEAP